MPSSSHGICATAAMWLTCIRLNRLKPLKVNAIAPNAAASLAVDGDVWIVTTAGDVMRYRRLTTSFTATRVDFTPRWTEPVKPVAIQAIDVQRSIYFLDASGKKVIQMGRDGRELARFILPPTLPPPSAFYVSEGGRAIYSLHGSKIVVTELTSR